MLKDIIFSLFLLACLEAAIFFPQFFVWFVVFAIIVGFFHSKDILSLMLISMAFVYLALINIFWLLQVAAIGCSFIYFCVVRRYFDYSFWVYLTAFFWFVQIYSVYLSLYVPLWLMVGWVITVCIILSFVALSKSLKQEDLKDLPIQKGSFVILVGFIMGEMVWVMSFLPFNALTLSGLLMLAFFVLVDFAEKHLLVKLSKKIILSRVILGLACSSAILLTTQWLPK